MTNGSVLLSFGVVARLNETAGPSTALRSDRDDNLVEGMAAKRISSTTVDEGANLPFVIPSEAEGSAVPLNQQALQMKALNPLRLLCRCV
jgi:hypothetical protein